MFTTIGNFATKSFVFYMFAISQQFLKIMYIVLYYSNAFFINSISEIITS